MLFLVFCAIISLSSAVLCGVNTDGMFIGSYVNADKCPEGLVECPSNTACLFGKENGECAEKEEEAEGAICMELDKCIAQTAKYTVSDGELIQSDCNGKEESKLECGKCVEYEGDKVYVDCGSVMQTILLFIVALIFFFF